MEAAKLLSGSADRKLQRFMAALKQCSRSRDVERVREIHAQLVCCDRVSNKYIASSLINCYAKSKSMLLARMLFDGMLDQDVATWNALLQGYVDNGECKLALEMFDVMVCVPNSRTYAAAVMACATLAETRDELDSMNKLWLEEKGRVLHASAVSAGCCDEYVETVLIKLFASVGDMESARCVFERNSTRRDIVIWTALLKGYVKNGEGEVALEIYERMKRNGCDLDARTYAVVVAACASLTSREGGDKWLEKAEQVHLEAVESGCCDVYVGNALVEMYFRFGEIVQARRVFYWMPVRDVVSWNTLLQGYVENGDSATTLELFDQMEVACLRNSRTYVACLSACVCLAVKETGKISETERKWFDKGKALHSEAVDRRACDIFVENVLIDLYSHCGRMDEAHRLFDIMKRRDVVTWTTLLKGYVENGKGETALELFVSMENAGCVPNYRTFGVAVTACGTLASRRDRRKWLEKAKLLHSRAVSCSCFNNNYVQAAMVHVYAAFGEMSLSRSVFDEMTSPDVVSWTALIKGYVDNGERDVALQLFHKMKLSCAPTARTYAAVLQACSGRREETSLKLQRFSIHSEILRKTGTCDVFVETGLVNMHSMSGELVLAQLVFDSMQEPNAVSWNCIIQGYVKNGRNEQALKMISSMDSSGVELDSATYIAALAACANLMDVDRGEAFHERVKKLGLESNVMVSTSLVNFYGKCGNMILAQEIFDRIVVDKDVVAWNALLCGYSLKGDVERVLDVFEEMKEQGVAPDEVSFVCILTACSHSGLTEKAMECFQSMADVHGIRPKFRHYACVVDVLGRANCLNEVMKLVETMPFKPSDVIWSSLLRLV